MTDEQIVECYWNRDENAITFTQEKYEHYLIKIAYNILFDLKDSKESVNDTYFAAWESIPPQRPTLLSTYLGKITRRISIDIYRKKHRKKREGSQYELSLEELKDCLSDKNTPDEEFSAKLLGEKINDFLKTLSVGKRNIFIGRYYFLDSISEIANYCHMSESRVKTNLFRTRKALKEYLEKEGFYL